MNTSGTILRKFFLDLVDLLLVRRLKPWSQNARKRLVKTPKLYIRDSGITHALLTLRSYNDLLGHPVAGGSWEGFVIENILSAAPDHVILFYYRTSNGAEIDLVPEISGRKKWAIEIKRNSTPTLSKEHYSACNDIKADKIFVVYAGQDRFTMAKNTTAISVAGIMEDVLKL